MIRVLNGAVRMHKAAGFNNPSEDAIWLVNNLNIQKNIITCLDVGCGTGVASLCAKHLYPHIQLTGIDIQEEAIEAAKNNSELNNLDIQWLQRDIIKNPLNQKFDMVFSNPPFHRSDKGFNSQKNNISFATTKKGVTDWVQTMLNLTANEGSVNLIHHKQNEELICDFFSKYTVEITHIKTSTTKPAKRILVRIIK